MCHWNCHLFYFILFYLINCHYNKGKPRNTLAFKLKHLVCARRGSFAGLSSILIPRGSSLGESWGEVGGGGAKRFGIADASTDLRKLAWYSGSRERRRSLEKIWYPKLWRTILKTDSSDSFPTGINSGGTVLPKIFDRGVPRSFVNPDRIKG